MTRYPKRKLHALAALDDLVSDFLYYGRKEDEDLSREDLARLFAGGDLTIDECAERFRDGLAKGVGGGT